MSERIGAQDPLLLDTTMRDGHQTPGVNFGVDDKIEIATLLADIGVDIVEAGYPFSSPADFRAVEEVAKEVGDRVIVSSFGRITLPDVEAACEAVEPAKKYGHARVHIGIATSELHMAEKLHMTRAQVLTATRLGVARAKEFTDDVQFYAEDASRSDFDFLMAVLIEAAGAGATTLMVPDTVGACAPDQYGNLIRSTKGRLAKEFGAGAVAVSAHCHNDLGLATINTLAALADGEDGEEGADQVEAVVGGYGERAGNASLEEVAITMHLLPHLVSGRQLGIEMSGLTHLANTVAELGGVPLPQSKPVVGPAAHEHKSGIHQDGVDKGLRSGVNTIYTPYPPELVGQETTFCNDAQSGKAGARSRLEAIGMDVTPEQVKEISEKATLLAGNEGRDVVDSDFEALAALVTGEELVDQIKLDDFTASKSKGQPSFGSVEVGNVKETAISTGGELDAVAIAIYKATGLKCEIKKWKTGIKVPGSNAAVGVFGTLAMNGHEVRVYARSTSTVEAEIETYAKGLNMLCRIQERTVAVTPES